LSTRSTTPQPSATPSEGGGSFSTLARVAIGAGAALAVGAVGTVFAAGGRRFHRGTHRG
jgi:hypothetical protein